MKYRFAALAVVATAVGACAPRQAEVRTAPAGSGGSAEASPAVSFTVENTTNDGVNVYLVSLSGSETFLRQVDPHSNTKLPVQGVAAGTHVTLKAVSVDGAHTYTKKNVALTGTVLFTLP